MPKRNTQQRRRTILELIEQDGNVSVEHLASTFSVSEVTIRKDLKELENNGLLVRRYGGATAYPADLIQASPSNELSMTKLAIARAASELIRDHNRIIIDSGSTTVAMLPELNHRQGLVVMTNALSVANALRELENEPTLLMTGGTWDTRSESFQGQLAEQTLRAYDFDQLFIGADGIDPERGTTTYNELLGVSQVMADVSREVIVLAEANKVGRKIHNLELPWQRINTLVTERSIDDTTKQLISSQGVNVICAPKQ